MLKYYATKGSLENRPLGIQTQLHMVWTPWETTLESDTGRSSAIKISCRFLEAHSLTSFRRLVGFTHIRHSCKVFQTTPHIHTRKGDPSAVGTPVLCTLAPLELKSKNTGSREVATGIPRIKNASKQENASEEENVLQALRRKRQLFSTFRNGQGMVNIFEFNRYPLTCDYKRGRQRNLCL